MASGDPVIVEVNNTAVIGWFYFVPAVGVEICTTSWQSQHAQAYFGLKISGAGGQSYNDASATTSLSRNNFKMFINNTYGFAGYGDWTTFTGIQIK